MKHLIFILIMIFSLDGYSQRKFEIEGKISESQVPENALIWLNETINNPHRLKWYVEQTGNKLSYEAKFKWHGDKYSVEFDSDGKIEDVEKESKLKRIDNDLTDAIKNYFEETYDWYKISKFQIQYSGDSEKLSNAINAREYEEVTIRYEIVFDSKLEGENTYWEVLLAENGELLEKKEVILDNATNLTY